MDSYFEALYGCHSNSLDRIIDFNSGNRKEDVKHILPSPLYFFDCNSTLSPVKEIVQDNSKLQTIDYSLLRNKGTEPTKPIDSINGLKLPLRASLLKFKTGEVVLYIPYTPLIRITKHR